MLFRLYNSLNLKAFGIQSLCRDTSLKGLLGFFWDINKRNMCEDGKANTRILFCGPHFPASHNYTKEYLQKCPSIQVDDLPFDSIPDLIGNYDICVVKSMRLNSDVIARATRMKLIMQYGVGLEGIDIAAATNHGIKVARIPSGTTGNAASCAEMAIYFMLGLLRKQMHNKDYDETFSPVANLPSLQLVIAEVNIHDWTSNIKLIPRMHFQMMFFRRKCISDNLQLCGLRGALENEMQIAVRQKKLGEPIGDTLLGKTVFIMGFGNIGIELAKRLRPFGVRILATKRNWASYVLNGFNSTEPTSQNDTREDLVDEKGSHEDMYKFAKISDIVVCCLTMNSETAGIINKNFVSSMKKGCLLVNIARGGLLDYEAVHNSLKSGHLGGLGIDVAWTEPFDPDDPILKFPNVLLTPHVAGVTEFSYRSMAKVVGDVAFQLHSGKPLTGIEFVN